MRADSVPGVLYSIYWNFIRLNVEKGRKSTSTFLPQLFFLLSIFLISVEKHDKNYEH